MGYASCKPADTLVLFFLFFCFCFFLFVCESNISVTAERVCTNSQGRHVWSLTQTSLNVKVKGQGHEEQKTKNCLVIPIDYA